MRIFLNAIKNLPHPEERPQGASRRTHDANATLSEVALRRPYTRTTILPLASPASISRCASLISSNRNTFAGFAL